MSRATAAKGSFPYPHRTIAEIDAERAFLEKAAARVERANKERAINSYERGVLRAFRKVAA